MLARSSCAGWEVRAATLPSPAGPGRIVFPPTTFRRHHQPTQPNERVREGPTNAGYVQFFRRRAASKTAQSLFAAPGCGDPSSLSNSTGLGRGNMANCRAHGVCCEHVRDHLDTHGLTVKRMTDEQPHDTRRSTLDEVSCCPPEPADSPARCQSGARGRRPRLPSYQQTWPKMEG